MTPGKIRDVLARIKSEVRDVEFEMGEKIKLGVVAYVQARQELTEAWEALDRALEEIDQNYRRMT